jgi:hypothetical protein
MGLFALIRLVVAVLLVAASALSLFGLLPSVPATAEWKPRVPYIVAVLFLALYAWSEAQRLFEDRPKIRLGRPQMRRTLYGSLVDTELLLFQVLVQNDGAPSDVAVKLVDVKVLAITPAANAMVPSTRPPHTLHFHGDFPPNHQYAATRHLAKDDTVWVDVVSVTTTATHQYLYYIHDIAHHFAAQQVLLPKGTYGFTIRALAGMHPRSQQFIVETDPDSGHLDVRAHEATQSVWRRAASWLPVVSGSYRGTGTGSPGC